MVMFLIAAAMNFISYWFSDTMVLKAYQAQEVGEGLVADLAQRADLPMPKVTSWPIMGRDRPSSPRRLGSWTFLTKMKSAVSWPMK